MDGTNPSARLARAREQLVEILGDPRVMAFALRKADGDPDTAQDALQSAGYAMLRLSHLADIENLWGYLYRVLSNEIARERGQLGALLVDDFAHTEERQAARSWRPPAATEFEESVCISVQAWQGRRRLAADRAKLLASVPGRSVSTGSAAGRAASRVRYRALIYLVAERVLRDLEAGEPSEADSRDALTRQYREYFSPPGISRSYRDQRLSRARDDIQALLQKVMGLPARPGRPDGVRFAVRRARQCEVVTRGDRQ